MFKTVAFMILTVLAFDAAASGCRAVRNTNSTPEPSATPGDQTGETPTGDLKILAQGSNSSITNPFVAIARDSDTYSAIRRLDGNLPQLDDEFFKTRLVVAAFLGERNTGGYSVEVTSDAGGQIRIVERKPGKDMMVTQAITSPFKVVSVSVTGVKPLSVWFDDAWRKQMRAYRLTNGTFTMTGGIIGVSETFGLQGELKIMREGMLATFAFELVSSGAGKARNLTEVATGQLQVDGMVINKMSSGSLVNPPSSGLKTMATFMSGSGKLSLSFNSLPSMVADGFVGRGTAEAETSSPDAKR